MIEDERICYCRSMIHMLSKSRVLIFDIITVQARIDNRGQNKYTTSILKKNCDHIAQYFLDIQLISNKSNFDYAFIGAWSLNSISNEY